MNDQTTLSIIKERFAKAHNEYLKKSTDLKKLITEKEKELQELRKEAGDYVKDYRGWTKLLLYPVIIEIERALPGWHFDGSLQPQGASQRVALFFCKDLSLPDDEKYSERNSVYIAFRPGKLEIGELLYETDKKKKWHAKTQVVERFGLNLVAKPLESIEEAVNFLKRQM